MKQLSVDVRKGIVVRDYWSPRPDAGIDCTVEPSLTKQSFREEVDINNIVQRYSQTGIVDHLNTLEAHYGDFSEVKDYQSALNAVIAAQERFEELPATIRDRFDNDAGMFLEFVSDERNGEELVRLGLAKLREESPTPPRQPTGSNDAPPKGGGGAENDGPK